MAIKQDSISSGIVFIHDGRPFARTIYASLKARFTVEAVNWADRKKAFEVQGLTVIWCITPLTSANLSDVKKIFAEFPSPPIFVFQSYNVDSIERLWTINDADYFLAPVAAAELNAEAAVCLTIAVEKSWENLPPQHKDAMQMSSTGFKDYFAAAAGGKPQPVDRLHDACAAIESSLSVGHIEDWLVQLRQHHDATYVHSMYVCGV